jgi:hypothetical protein
VFRVVKSNRIVSDAQPHTMVILHRWSLIIVKMCKRHSRGQTMALDRE